MNVSCAFVTRHLPLFSELCLQDPSSVLQTNPDFSKLVTVCYGQTVGYLVIFQMEGISILYIPPPAPV